MEVFETIQMGHELSTEEEEKSSSNMPNPDFKLNQTVSEVPQILHTNAIDLQRIQNFEHKQDFIKELVCFACERIPKNPLQCDHCDIIFCEECLIYKDKRDEEKDKNDEKLKKQTKQKDNCCPLKCVGAKFKNIRRMTQNILKKVLISCQYQKNGCEELMNYFNLSLHEQGCGYQIVQCREFVLCETSIYLKDQVDHETFCPFVPLACQYCNIQIRRKDLNDHLNKCPQMPLQCSYCNEVLTRQLIYIHEANCDEKIINCESCQQEIKQKMKDSHSCISYLSNMLQFHKETIKELNDQVHMLQCQVLLNSMKYNIKDEEWLFLCKVESSSIMGYYDKFWTEFEPVNAYDLLNQTTVRRDFQQSLKSLLFYYMPVSELLIETQYGTKVKLELPQKSTLCSLFQQDVTCALKFIYGNNSPLSLTENIDGSIPLHPTWGINLKNKQQNRLCRLGGFFEILKGDLITKDEDSPNTAGFGIEVGDERFGFGYIASNDKWLQDESQGAILYGK